MTTSSRKCGRLAIFATFSHRYEDQNHLLKDGILLGEWYSLHLLTKLFSWVQRKISSSDIFLVIDTTFWRKRMIDIPGPTFSNAICVWCSLCKTFQKLLQHLSTLEIGQNLLTKQILYTVIRPNDESLWCLILIHGPNFNALCEKNLNYCCP